MHDPELAIVYDAIEVFYSGQNNSQAAAWLDDFQKSILAWTACDRILGERKNPVASYFAAQTLRQKILKNLKEVPRESLESLRDSIINHLTHLHVVDQSSEATATQLCLAVVDLYIQVPEWVGFIATMLNKFNGLEGDRTKMLLTLLKVFPEEVEHATIGENRRKAVREELAINGDSILVYLAGVLSSALSKEHHDEDIVKKVVQCLSTFLQNPNVHTDRLAQSDLFTVVFSILASPFVSVNLHDAATECVVSGLVRVEDIHAHRALAVVLHQASFKLQQAWNEAVSKEQLDRLSNFTRIFVELCESLIEPVVNQNKEAAPLHELNIFELLLLIANHFDYSLIEMTFNVWYRISEALFMIDDDDHIALFKPFVKRYLVALVRHSRYDSDEVGLPDQHSDFGDFRFKVRETVKDVAFIVGTDDCIKMMFTLMAEAAQKNAPWEETEAALFIASNVIQNLLPEEDSIVPELISQLVQLAPQTAHPALILTAIQFMGGCSEWLGKHPPIQDPVMQWLLVYVVNPIYASHASESIEKICSQASIVRFIPPLSAAIERLEATTTNGKCVEKACQDITKALATLCNSLSRQELGEQLKKICEPILMRLTMSIDASTVQVAHDENKGDAWMQMAHKPLIWIDRIASVFREIKPLEKINYDLNQPQPWLPVAQHTLQISSQILTKYEADGRIIEHTCRAIRHVIRSLGMQSASFVPTLATQLMTIYQHHQHSCILYLASIIVDEYGALQELQDGLIQMLQMLATSTFPILQKTHGFRNNPDTVDDLFRLAHRYITRCPSVFFVHPICEKLLDCALHGLHVDHGEANRSVTKYTTEMINQLISARRHNYIDDGVKAAQQLVNSYADRLIEHALKAALFDVSSYLRRELTDVICSLGKYDRELQARALIHAISTLPRGPLCATEEQLKEFHDQVCKDGTDTRNVVGYVRELVKLYQ